MARLASRIVAAGLLRAAEAAGGNGVVLARGDPDSGALMLVLTSRGADPRILERVAGNDDQLAWNLRQSSGESRQDDSVARFIDKNKRFDRDLWVLELDVPDVHRFIVDSLSQT